ncbi:nucleotide sugar dehydrogenase [Haladaptatus sp. DYF46]|uniref:nucleotide sugar dehydrogenase n=1 Tax=Haladaptatus sp. DYF46 TaxID=2886041 RepID=UPI001E3D85F2|nr:nucleotide sugar dehydrogenase [Haladaptatus sp. DYF46]
MTSEQILQHIYGTNASNEQRRDALTSGQIPVAVYGLGKMGLPLAAVYADVTGNVTGADINPNVVSAVERGDCHISGEPGLPELVSDLSERDALRAVEDPRSAATDSSIHVIIVPTLINDDKSPDLSVLRAVSEDISLGLSAGDLIIVESTVPPKTCRETILQILEEGSGLELGEFGLAFCPERTSSGRALQDIRGAYPKVVGGADATSTDSARLIYEEINSEGVLTVSDITVAEAVKVFEGLYRDVNIALANELALFADELGIDVNEAIETANTQPFCDIHTPGPGVGGHCIPYYPYFLIKSFETDAPLLKTARQINDGMPEFTVAKLHQEFEAEGRDLEGSTVLVLGLTYRPGIDEIRATPAKPIVEMLTDLGVNVRTVDPVLSDFGPFDGVPTPMDEMYSCDPDAAVLVTDHKEFSTIDWTRFDPLVVIDGRQALHLDDTPHRVYTIGDGY